jgi:undecaprenyl-diphosphatase
MANVVRDETLAERHAAPNPDGEARAGQERDGRERASEERDSRKWWRVPPVDRRGLILWIVAYAVMTAVAIGVGLLVVHELGGVRAFDDRVARWLERRRTGSWDDATWVGSMIADADIKIALTVVLCAGFAWRWRRWAESALLAGALTLEVAVFTTSSFIVDRGRPPIPQLDPVPPTGAFPSGHSAAAAAFYGAIAIIVCWHTRNRLARGVAIAGAVVLPLVVGASRMYRGMHHFSDVLAGLVIGLIALWVTWLVVRRGPAIRLDATRDSGGD